MTNSIPDVTEQADVIMMVGTNAEEAHPVLGMHIRRAVERGARLIVVDPRTIRLSARADIHLKLRPGTNVALFNGMTNILIQHNLIDEEFIAQRTENFDELKRVVAAYTPERVAEICGIDQRMLVEAALMYGRANTAAIMYCLGVTEHTTGTAGVLSLSNLAMAAGKIGRPGCGVNPLRGQNNVQGACDMGANPDNFPGYQKFTTPGVFEKFENAWGVSLNRTVGHYATDQFNRALEGSLKAMYIMGEDPMRTDPDIAHVMKALKALDFLVVQELFMTETAKMADVVLPGCSYAEKEGTFTNTERRIQRVRAAVPVHEGARLDTDIFIDVMNRMGYPQPHLTAAEIMDEVARLDPAYGGVSHARLDSAAFYNDGLQWPVPTKTSPSTAILHVGAFTRGRGLFKPEEYRAPAETADARYPIIMMTGRVLHQYNACAMTARTKGINELGDSSFIEINTTDASQLGIEDGDRVRVCSRRGCITSSARVSDKTTPGHAWMPFHYEDGNSNWITNGALDDHARVPEYKVCAINVSRVPRSAAHAGDKVPSVPAP